MPAPFTGVSIIVATTMEARRAQALERAVASILDSCPQALPILVANGSRADAAVLARWQSCSEVQFHRLDAGDYLKARLFGRQLVKTEFFGFLDDDDLLLPASIPQRLEKLRNSSSTDVVVGNGFAVKDSRRTPMLSHFDLHQQDPLQGLCVENWLASCAGLFRTSSIGVEFFAHDDRHLEWTALAIRLCTAGKKIEFLQAPTYEVNDTPGSLSKSVHYQLGLTKTLRSLLELPLPPTARHAWRRKYGAALHQLADYHRTHEGLLQAWPPHVRSLFQPGGWKYLSFTRRLMGRVPATSRN